MKAESTPRIHLIFSLLLLFALVLVARLFFVQVVNGQSFEDMANSQYVVENNNSFNRGNIFFQKRGGELVSAATLKTGYIISINPKKITDAKEIYDNLVKIVDIDKQAFFIKAGKKDDPYEEIAKRVEKKDALTIQKLGLSGVSIHKESWRFYPGENTASSVLGFVAFTGDDLEGQYGIERYYNDVLSRNDKGLYVNFFAELFSNITETFFVSENSREGDVVLNIDPVVQSYTEYVISEMKDKWSADLSGAIIMDPNNGKIYAMATMPSFNLNDFKNANSNSFSNPLVESVYEMGSIIKPITMASAIDAGAIKVDDIYEDKGFVILNGARIENYDGKARGVVPMQEILNQSLNTGVVYAMQKMGKEVSADYLRKFGLGLETGIELPNEVYGLIDNLNSKREIEHATASFGQGIAMTPIETITALAVLGNGGRLVSPSLVDRIEYESGGSKKTYPDEGVRVLSKNTSEEITRMLVEVVDKALLDGTVALPDYSIAAKTGTAQIADMQNGGYYEDKYLHSFFGYFPAYEPRFIIFLYNVNPKGVRYASQTLTMPFMNLTKFLINYYEISPDR